MLLSEVDNCTSLGEIICYQPRRKKGDKKEDQEVYAEKVSCISLVWLKDKWVVAEYWTPFFPECPNYEVITPDQVRESIISSEIELHNPEIPDRPPYLPGDRIDFNAGDGPDSGTVREVECLVDKHGPHLRYALIEQPEMESICESWLLENKKEESK